MPLHFMEVCSRDGVVCTQCRCFGPKEERKISHMQHLAYDPDYDKRNEDESEEDKY